MKKNDTINFVFLFLCVLLLGFVYLSNKMPERSVKPKHSIAKESMEKLNSLQ